MKLTIIFLHPEKTWRESYDVAAADDPATFNAHLLACVDQRMQSTDAACVLRLAHAFYVAFWDRRLTPIAREAMERIEKGL